MSLLAEKLLDAIGDISSFFVDEADDGYFIKKSFRKPLKYGALGLVASVGVAAAVWLYQSKRERRSRAA